MKAVFDTNVLISALITTGKARLLFDKAVEKQIQLVISKEMLAEFSTVVAEPRIRKYANEKGIINFLDAIGRIAQVAKVKSQFEAVKQDPMMTLF